MYGCSCMTLRKDENMRSLSAQSAWTRAYAVWNNKQRELKWKKHKNNKIYIHHAILYQFVI